MIVTVKGHSLCTLSLLTFTRGLTQPRVLGRPSHPDQTGKEQHSLLLGQNHTRCQKWELSNWRQFLGDSCCMYWEKVIRQFLIQFLLFAGEERVHSDQGVLGD